MQRERYREVKKAGRREGGGRGWRGRKREEMSG